MLPSVRPQSRSMSSGDTTCFSTMTSFRFGANSLTRSITASPTASFWLSQSCAPYNLAAGAQDWDNQKEAFGDAVIDLVSEFAPNLKDVIVEKHVVSPLDMERDWGLTEGNIFHGELSLEQLFFSRPIPGWARYR